MDSGSALRASRNDVSRRLFIAGIASAATYSVSWPLAARAQNRPHLVGYLTLNSGPTPQQSGAFERGLQELGYRPGQNITIEYRWGAGRLERLEALAQELVGLKPDVIVVAATPVVHAVKKATASIPIVIAHSADPVQTGFAASLARPGGNITGLSVIATDLAPKRIELLRELLPGMTRIAFLAHGADPAAKLFMDQTQVAADQFGLSMQRVVVRGPEDFEHAFATMMRERADVVVVQPIFLQAPNQTRQIIELAAKHRLPSVSDYWEEFVSPGGLMSYGASRADLYRRAATYVDKILKGTPPSELPIELPTRFELGINLKTAKTLGLTVPLALLARADEVIE
jgi:putative ABC transport system substrate-binding protein